MTESHSSPKRIAEGIEFALVDIELLKEHEEVYPEKVDELAQEIKKDGVVKKPILIDKRTYTILDGHHRYQALKKLGCKRIPAILVDYLNDDRITVTLWPTAKIDYITKEMVIKTALSGKKFTPKTSRHIVHIEIPEIEVELTRLY
ncbi:MAG: ParB N-terminal domain-containing protein [Euryarchaeota archaeon]|nr:ParB N-terminal domain-containing protein [Euryarchaeota archaeon]